MTNPIRTAATLATTLALTAAVVSAGPAATPADPREAVVLITTRTASGEAAQGYELPVEVEVADPSGKPVFRARIAMWISPRKA